MSEWEPIETAISDATGQFFKVKQSGYVGGGCINEAQKITDGSTSFFVKFNAASQAEMFEAEFDGLKEISETNAIRVPKPVCRATFGRRCWIVMEYITFGHERRDTQRKLGRRLAALHQTTHDEFGWHRDNTIGSTPQINTRTPDWVEFYREHRLRFQLDLARRNGRRFRGAEELLDRLDAFFDGYDPQASLLHGDLWSGNVSCDESGNPVIFDPATYYGDHEAEFGIIEMFGGFGGDFYAGYNEAFPLDEGFKKRLPLYLLYHQLNHFNLFGGGYGHSAQSTIDRLLR